MRDYGLNTDKLVNSLTPHYLGGRKMVLFIQSLIYPLQNDANRWDTWSKNIFQEAAMTSQIFLFEHFLNSRFSQYFTDPNQKIEILDTTIHSESMYWKRVQSKKTHFPVRMKSEGKTDTPIFYYKDEKQKYTDISFLVQCPKINQDKISTKDFEFQIGIFLNRYRISGKNYVIEYK